MKGRIGCGGWDFSLRRDGVSDGAMVGVAVAGVGGVGDVGVGEQLPMKMLMSKR